MNKTNMISGSNLTIEDAVFYCDERLAKVNIYNVTIAIYNYETLYPDLYSEIKSYCIICILQECSNYHCKFTFVTTLKSTIFNLILSKALTKIRIMRKLTENQMVLL